MLLLRAQAITARTAPGLIGLRQALAEDQKSAGTGNAPVQRAITRLKAVNYPLEDRSRSVV